MLKELNDNPETLEEFLLQLDSVSQDLTHYIIIYLALLMLFMHLSMLSSKVVLGWAGLGWGTYKGLGRGVLWCRGEGWREVWCVEGRAGMRCVVV